MEWRSVNSPRPEKPQMSKFEIKTMLICFLNISGIIHFEFVPEGTTVNETFYVDVLKRLIDAVRHKLGELWRGHSLIPHHDNMPAHSLLQMSQLLDLGPADLRLFPKLKILLKGKHISDIEDIKSYIKKLHTFLLTILRTVLNNG
jgi:hypothetical protein